MTRTISVKGVGKATAKVDYIVLSMSLESLYMDYDKAVEIASAQIESLRESLEKIGFNKEDLKTTNFNVGTHYESNRDHNDNFKRVFKGFKVSHDLKLAFDFSVERLSLTLSAILKSNANPDFSIRFTIKNPNNLKEDMLKDASENAKKKAEILCQASGVKLGELVRIDYNWGEINIYSSTRYSAFESEPMLMRNAIEFEPEDVEESDSATFVWEII